MEENRQFELVPPDLPCSQEAFDSRAESAALLGLSTVVGMGYQRLYDIRKAALSFATVINESSAQNLSNDFRERSLRIPKAIVESIVAENEQIVRRGREQLRFLEQQQVSLIHQFDDMYPGQLLDLEYPPGWIFVQGDESLLATPSVSIVGTRRPSKEGQFIGQFLLYLLHNAGIPTVSGLANGIDRLVHEMSIELGIKTIAVLGNGIHQDYPHDSKQLRKRIVEYGGCIVSEYLPSEKPTKKSFVWRNRIQAALSRVTIPVEWKMKSGTAHTVRYAFEIGRDVVALGLPKRRGPELDFVHQSSGQVFCVPSEGEDLLTYLARVLD